MEFDYSYQWCGERTNSKIVNENLVLDSNQGIEGMELLRYVWSVH